MDVLLDATFDRLLSKYERTFGEQPPYRAADADEVVSHMRRRLRQAFAAELRRPTGPAAPAGGAGDGRTTH